MFDIVVNQIPEHVEDTVVAFSDDFSDDGGDVLDGFLQQIVVDSNIVVGKVNRFRLAFFAPENQEGMEA